MKKRICAVLSALALAFSVPLPVSAEEYTYPKMADDYFALVEEYPDYFRMQDNSVYFMAHSFLSNPALIVCSENQFTVQDVNYGYVFTPEESGRYVVTLEETTLDSVAYEDIVADVQYKRYFSYIVDVKNGETTVTCQNLYHPDESVYNFSSCVEDNDFYSFVNGMLPNAETGNDRYFTTVFENSKVQSLFCLSYPYSKETQSKMVGTSDQNVAWQSMTMRTASAFDADNMLTLYVVSARSDGEVTITANEKEEYELIVENGIFRYRTGPDIPRFLMGDVNDDGEFTASDVVLLQNWLLAVPDTHLANWKAADFNNDNKLNATDFCLMKRELLEKVQTPISVTMAQTGGVMAVHYEYKAYQDGEKYYISYLNKRSVSDPVVTEITEDKFKSILSLDYAKYIGTEDPRNGKFSDEFNYHTVITYSDGTEKTTDVSISELIAMLKNWSKTSNNEW